MKVKELVEQLLKEDQEATVVKTSDNFELNHAIVEVQTIGVYKGNKVNKSFYDAFDGESYNKDVWELFSGNENVVKI